MVRDPFRLFPGSNQIWQYSFYNSEGAQRHKSTGVRIKGAPGSLAYKRSEEEARKSAEVKLGLRVAVHSPTLEAFTAKFFIWGECPIIATRHAGGKSFDPAWAKNCRGILDNYIIPEFGARKLVQITTPMIWNWILKLSVSNQYRKHIVGVFSKCMDEAVLQRKIERNPCRDLPKIVPANEKQNYLTEEEIGLLFPASFEECIKIWKTEFWMVYHRLMLHSGMRPQSVRAKRWNEIHWDSQIVGNYRAVKADQKEIALPKWDKEGATILADFFNPEKIHDERSWQMLKDWREHSPFKRDDDFVFPGRLFRGPRGQSPIGAHMGGNVLAQALKNAGITKKITARCFRNTFVTHMKKKRPHLVQMLVGHSDPRTTKGYDWTSPVEALQIALREPEL